MPKRANTKNRHRKVVESFDKLYGEKEEFNGKKIRKYEYNYCLHKVGKEHDYSADGVRAIINGYK